MTCLALGWWAFYRLGPFELQVSPGRSDSGPSIGGDHELQGGEMLAKRCGQEQVDPSPGRTLLPPRQQHVPQRPPTGPPGKDSLPALSAQPKSTLHVGPWPCASLWTSRQAGSELGGRASAWLHSWRHASYLRELTWTPRLVTLWKPPHLPGGGHPQCEPHSLCRRQGAASILRHSSLPSEKNSETSRP